MTVKQSGSADVTVSLFEEDNGPCVRNFTMLRLKYHHFLMDVYLGVKGVHSQPTPLFITRFHWKAKDSLGSGDHVAGKKPV